MKKQILRVLQASYGVDSANSLKVGRKKQIERERGRLQRTAATLSVMQCKKTVAYFCAQAATANPSAQFAQLYIAYFCALEDIAYPCWASQNIHAHCVYPV